MVIFSFCPNIKAISGKKAPRPQSGKLSLCIFLFHQCFHRCPVGIIGFQIVGIQGGAEYGMINANIIS